MFQFTMRAATLSLLTFTLQAINAVDLKVSGTKGNATSPLQYGIMFEDINNSGDGGIYAELIQNRAFQANDASSATLDPWTAVNGADLKLVIDDGQPLSSTLPFSVRVSGDAASTSPIGLSNPGYWGFTVAPQDYVGSFYVRGDYEGAFTASIANNISGDVFASIQIDSKSVANAWTLHDFTIKPASAAPNSNNTFSITFAPNGTSGGSLDFNFISLFPPTYASRPNGMRPELMQALKDLKPSFLRMPGGNNLEGYSPYQLRWNDTIGPQVNRQGFPGAWGYYNTNGLGIAEYLNWCVDLDMEPLLAVWAGFWLDGKSLSESDLQFYVQDALNELEYIMGDTSTKYGALRAQHGFPEPWKVKYVEIGNEDNLNGGASSYTSYRFKAFYDTIHAAYPDITLIASTIDISLPDTAAGDYHIYDRPDDLVSQFTFFDQSTSTHQTLVGEYAIVQPNVQGQTGVNWNEPRSAAPFWIGTVAEAIFLLGAEKNAQGILGVSYAPTLQNKNRWQWAPNLIGFEADTSKTDLSTSYHLVKLFSNNRMTETRAATANAAYGPAYWATGFDAANSKYVLKAAVYNATASVPFNVAFDGVKSGASASLTVLTAPDAYSVSDVDSKVTTLTAGSDGSFKFELPALSIALLLADQ